MLELHRAVWRVPVALPGASSTRSRASAGPLVRSSPPPGSSIEGFQCIDVTVSHRCATGPRCRVHYLSGVHFGMRLVAFTSTTRFWLRTSELFTVLFR